MNDNGHADPHRPLIDRRSELSVRRFAIWLTRRDLPSPLLSLVVRALGNHEPAELSAVFVEDADLLNAVALPFTHELCGLTNAMRPIDRARLEAHFQRESAAAATAVAELTRVVGRQCRFEVLRARKAAALRATLAGADALFLPGAAPATRREGGAGLLAVVDDSDSATHCEILARRLAAAVGAPLEMHKVRSGGDGIAIEQVPALLARRDPQLVLLAANLVPLLAHSAVELDEMCAPPLLIVN
ncbi:MAG: hypothetical protein IPG43_19065 [Proteobacteria bacterium]|nr:hypothetical protein [Pseudomonadota bacterium]